MLVSNINQMLLLKFFKILLQGNKWNNYFRKSPILSDKLVAMVTLKKPREPKITIDVS